MSFEDFLASAEHEAERDLYFVEGDMPFKGVEELRAYWDSLQSGQELAVRLNGSADSKWSDTQKRALTYCISNDFHSNKSAVVTALATAAREWMAAADVSFTYFFSYDPSCNSSNNNVVFDVRPSSDTNYIAKSFWPHSSRGDRTIYLTSLAFNPAQAGTSLTGVLRHELGHTLGFVHEHIRWSTTSGCTESTPYRTLTPEDHASVMAYAQCGGPSDYIHLSQRDIDGALLLYGQPLWRNPLWTPAYGDDAGWQNYDFHWKTIQYADLNGDGKDDVCGSAAVGMYCGLSTGAAFSLPTYWTSEYSHSTGWSSSPAYWSTIRLPDVNGDGKADVCGRADGGMHCALSNGSSFPSPTYWSSDFSDVQGWNSHASHWETIQFPDLNNDGKADVCGRGSSGIYCGLSTGTAFQPMVRWSTSYADAGLWNSLPSYWRTIRFPDLNGDNKPDICGRAEGGLFCALSNGSSFGTPTYWSTNYSNAASWNLDYYWETIQYVDLNGDNKDDVCGRGGSGMVCSISNGSSFNTATYWTTEFRNADGWASNPSYWRTISFPDLNGDGKADICGRGAAGERCAMSSGTAFGATVVRSTALSDAYYVPTSPTYYETIRHPDLDGDGDADFCYRSPGGLRCSY